MLTVLSARRGVRVSPRERTRHPRSTASPAGRSPGRTRRSPPASSRRRASSTARSRTRAGSSSRPASVLAAEHARARRVLVAEVAPRAAACCPLAPLVRPSDHDLVVDDLLERRSARALRDPCPALGAVPLLRLAHEAQRGARRAKGPPPFGRPVAVRLGLLALSALGARLASLPRRARRSSTTALVPRTRARRAPPTPSARRRSSRRSSSS